MKILFVVTFLLFVVSQGDAYYKNDAGKVCDDESHIIRSQTECTKALKHLGFPTTAKYWKGSHSSIPAGCSIRNGNDNRPHLDEKEGVGKGRKDLIPICKRPESSGCEDIDTSGHCPHWKDQGFCIDSHVEYMKTNCAKTCNTCG